MSTKIIQILGSVGNKIYIQPDEPTDAPEGSIWIDLDDESNTNVVSPNSTSGLLLTDRTTGTNYILYVDNGKLSMTEEV